MKKPWEHTWKHDGPYSNLMEEIDRRREEEQRLEGDPGGPTCGFDCDCSDSCLEFRCHGKDGKPGCGEEWSSSRAPRDWTCPVCGGKIDIW